MGCLAVGRRLVVVGCWLLVYLWDKLMVGFAFQPTTDNQQPSTNHYLNSMERLSGNAFQRSP